MSLFERQLTLWGFASLQAFFWGIKPFTMLGISTLFLGVFFKDLFPGTAVVKDGSTFELYVLAISTAIPLVKPWYPLPLRIRAARNASINEMTRLLS